MTKAQLCYHSIGIHFLFLGLDKVTNVQRGEVHGPAKDWPQSLLSSLGARLLFKMFVIYTHEGARQIGSLDMGYGPKPIDIHLLFSGLDSGTNVQRGEFHGPAKDWTQSTLALPRGQGSSSRCMSSIHTKGRAK